MLVGVPSSSKTEVIRSLADRAAHPLDEITVAGLLSWKSVRGKPPVPAGLLSRHQGRVFTTISDLSALLAMSDRGARDMLYAILRRVYDGQVTRDLGNSPGTLRWQGRMTFLAGVTPAIDGYASHADALGPRWLYWRLPTSSAATRRRTSSTARLQTSAVAEHREAVRDLASRVVAEAVSRVGNVAISETVGEAIDDASIVAGLGRGAVERSGYGRREILGLPVVEEPARLSIQLSQLARGLLALGIDETEVAARCRRAALDCIPPVRLRCLEKLAGGGQPTTAEVARAIGSHRHVTRAALEDLEAIGIVGRITDVPPDEAPSEDESRAPRHWYLHGEYAGLVSAVVTSNKKVARKVGSNSPNTPNKGEA